MLLLLPLLASPAYVSKNKKSAVCGLELAEPVCVSILPDGCCRRHYCCWAEIPRWAIARLCPQRCCYCCCVLLLWCCSRSLPHMFLKCAVLVVLSCIVHGLLFFTKFHIVHTESHRFLHISYTHVFVDSPPTF